MRRWLPVALLLSLLGGCGIVPAGPTMGAPAIRTQALAGFVTLAGRAASLGDFAGSPVVLTFLQPGQGDSEAQLPLVMRLAAAYQAQGVVWVVAGEQVDLAGLRRYVETHQLTMPVWADLGGHELARRQFASVPAHQFIARNGAVMKSHAGFMSRGELLEGLAAIAP